MLGGVAKLENDIERLGVCAFAAKAAGRADARQLDFADERAIHAVQLDLRARILQIMGDEQVADQADAAQVFLRFGNDFFPVFPRRLARVDGDEPAFGCFQIGFEVKDGPIVADKAVFVVEVLDEIDRQRVGFAEILVGDAILVIGALPDGQYEIAAVLGDVAFESPRSG